MAAPIYASSKEIVVRNNKNAIEKFTNRLQQALSDAQSLAMGKDHTAIEGIHILGHLA